MKSKSGKLRNRNNTFNKKINFVLASLLLMVVGYALITARININGSVAVAATGTWNIYLDNVTVNEGSADASVPAVINEADKTSASFQVSFSKPDDFYEFEADMVNDGKYDAMIKEVNVNGLPESLKKYFIYTVTYADGKEIQPKYLLASQTKDRIKVNVRLNGEEDLTDFFDVNSKLMGQAFEISVEIVFGQATDEAVDRTPGSIIKNLGLDKEAINDAGVVDFSKTSEENGTNGLYLLDSTKDDKYPIYYYRGNVNNNIIFAGYCWKIVRTTETGGTKLIYNGVVGSGDTCNNTGTNSQIGTSVFNSSYNASKYVGYTYDSNTDSTIKAYIDTWYETNIESESNNKHYEKYLEDTVWCNDRSVASTSGYGAYGRLITNKTPSLECPNKVDKYTLMSSKANYKAELNGNGYLKYPIGLLTADEVAMAGAVYNMQNASYYLYTGQDFWLLSPYYWDSSRAFEFYVYNTGGLDGTDYFVYYSGNGVRPSVSLKPGTEITACSDGVAGMVACPYKVVEN